MNSLAYTLTITSQWRNTEGKSKVNRDRHGKNRKWNGPNGKVEREEKENGQWRGIKREQQSSSNNQIKTKVSRHQRQSSRRLKKTEEEEEDRSENESPGQDSQQRKIGEHLLNKRKTAR